MGLGRCVVTHIICIGMKKKFHALWSLSVTENHNALMQSTSILGLLGELCVTYICIKFN